MRNVLFIVWLLGLRLDLSEHGYEEVDGGATRDQGGHSHN
jgi:hypothetical protein